MATQVQFRGGTTTEHASFNGAAREVTVDTTKQTLVVQDGSTNGGFPLLGEKNADNVKVNFGNGDDLEIYHDGTSSYLRNTTGNLYIESKSGETAIQAIPDGAVDLRYNGVKKLETMSWGAQVNGNFSCTGGGDIFLEDNGILYLGTSNDLQIYHDGSNSYLKSAGTGNIIFNSDNVEFKSDGGGNTGLKINTSGSVEAYHNNVKTFNTVANGIQVRGSEGTEGHIYLYADEGDDNTDLWLMQADQAVSGFYIRNKASGSWENNIKCYGNGGVELNYDNSKKIETLNYGVRVTGQLVMAQDYIKLDDNVELRCGNGDDLKIYHNGSSSYISNNGGNLYIESKSGETAIQIVPDGAVDLRYNGSKKFETASDGVHVSGKLIAETTGNDTDNAKFVNSGSTSDGTAIQIVNDSTTPADGDQTGYLQFIGNDTNGNATIYNAIIGYTDDVTDTEEDGSLKFFCRYEGSFAQRLAIAANGTFTGSGSNDISDQRLKDNIATVVDPIGKIKALKGRTFTWKPEANLPEGTKYGFIAQEVEAVVSDLVDNKHGLRQFDKDNNLIPQDEKAKINKDEGTTEAKAVHATGVVPILVEALKEALTKIETLETKVAALEAG